MSPAEQIIKYKMTQDEISAYKLCILWDSICEKELPRYKRIKSKQTGDPRKSLLFRYCYKLLKETRGLIEYKNYRLYITAQIHVLRNISDGNVHALIEPGCLTGDGAWRRWKLWKKRYDKAKIAQAVPHSDGKSSFSQIQSALIRTKKFLFEKFDGPPSSDQIHAAVQEFLIVKWLTLGKISPYYVLLSPFVANSIDKKSFEEYFMFDLSIYKSSVTDEVNNLFLKEFDYEYDKK